MGEWKNSETEGLEVYLKFMGVGWAKRKVATAFRPAPVFAIVDGVLQILLTTPIGERLERLPVDEPVVDTDPSGVEFVKESSWDGGTLVTLAKVRGWVSVAACADVCMCTRACASMRAGGRVGLRARASS